MPHTIVKIIARCEHVVFHRNQCLWFHVSRSQLTGRPALPIGICFFQFPLGLFRNVERIGSPGLHRVKLCFQPFIRKLRVCLAASGCNGRAPNDQLQITDDDRDIFQNVRKGFCTPDDHRLVLGLAV